MLEILNPFKRCLKGFFFGKQMLDIKISIVLDRIFFV